MVMCVWYVVDDEEEGEEEEEKMFECGVGEGAFTLVG